MKKYLTLSGTYRNTVWFIFGSPPFPQEHFLKALLGAYTVLEALLGACIGGPVRSIYCIGGPVRGMNWRPC